MHADWIADVSYRWGTRDSWKSGMGPMWQGGEPKPGSVTKSIGVQGGMLGPGERNLGSGRLTGRTWIVCYLQAVMSKSRPMRLLGPLEPRGDDPARLLTQ